MCRPASCIVLITVTNREKTVILYINNSLNIHFMIPLWCILLSEFRVLEDERQQEGRVCTGKGQKFKVPGDMYLKVPVDA